MTDHIPLLVAIGAASAVVGGAGYAFARGLPLRHRAAALTWIAYGALASSAATFFVLALHFHSATELHLHNSLAEVHEDLLGDPAVTVLLIMAVTFSSAFLANQWLALRLLRGCEGREDIPASAMLKAMRLGPPPFLLLATRDRKPDACTFAVLRRRGLRLFPQDIVVVSRGLVDLLPPDELRAALAHEAAHVRNGDSRYMPFFRTLASVVFFDPLLRAARGRLFQRSEFRADEEAVRETKEPLALARALTRLLLEGSPDRGAVGFLGGGSPLLVMRIERLLEIARRWGA